MTPGIPTAPTPLSCPIPEGTALIVDPSATFFARDLVSGGSPWRLLRLSPASAQALERWRAGERVGAGEGGLARTLVQQGLVSPRFEPVNDLDAVEVIVPVFGDAGGLAHLLGALDGVSVIVVDDGSPNAHEIREIAERRGAAYLRLDENVGPAGARNLGAAHATRPLVWFIDADVAPGDARRVAGDLQSHFVDPLVAAAAPRILGASGDSVRERFESRHGPLDLGATSAPVVPHAKVPYVPSACLMVRRAAYGDGFDDSMRVGEDVDFVWRLYDAGWLVRYDATTSVAHRARPALSAWLRQRHNYGRSAGELARRHPDRLAPVQVDLWTLAVWTALLARQPRLAGSVSSLATRSLATKLPSSVENPAAVAQAIAIKGMAGAGGPLARAVVRSYGPLVAAAVVVPKLRRPAGIIFVAGTAWRWRQGARFAPSDLPWALADDAAYATGVWRGAWSARSWRAIAPKVTGSTAGLRDALNAATSTPR